MNPTISIIIPVYNSELLLKRCLDSILSQSFCDYELLLIDDGSTDNSSLICDEYARMDTRIKVFHKHNGGMNTARNMGIERAKGKYLYFVDNDDYLLPGCLETLVDGIENPVVDIAVGNCLYLKGDEISTSPQEYELLLSHSDIIDDAEYKRNFHFGTLWVTLYKADIVKTNNIRFNIPLLLNDDWVFFFNYITHTTGNAYCTTKPIYVYNEGVGQLAQSSQKYDKRFVTIFYGQCLIYEMLRDHECSKKALWWAKLHVVRSYIDKKRFYQQYSDTETLSQMDCRLHEVLEQKDINMLIAREKAKSFLKCIFNKN